jgi:hypothetical protein
MSDAKKIRNNYILIDYENVQPQDFDIPQTYPLHVIVFVGANQKKIPIELVTTMQGLGANAQYVTIKEVGKNALDFHLTFYLGKLYREDPDGYFHIISKDRGFDTLINHLKEKKALINRYSAIQKVPALRQAGCETFSMEEKISLVVDHLLKIGDAKPRSVGALSNTINAICGRTLTQQQVESVVNAMAQEKLIDVDSKRVIYSLQK